MREIAGSKPRTYRTEKCKTISKRDEAFTDINITFWNTQHQNHWRLAPYTVTLIFNDEQKNVNKRKVNIKLFVKGFNMINIKFFI